MLSVHRIRKIVGTASTSSLSRLGFRSKKPKMNRLPIAADSCAPLATVLVPVDASIRRSPTPVTRAILRVGLLREHAQILSSAVQAVAVDMVYLNAITGGASKQCAVERYGRVDRAPSGVALSISIRVKRPTPLVHPLGVSGINKGISSNAAISGAERNTHGGIIKAHRPSPLGGVTPRPVSAGAGFHRVNFTSYFE